MNLKNLSRRFCDGCNHYKKKCCLTCTHNDLTEKEKADLYRRLNHEDK